MTGFEEIESHPKIAMGAVLVAVLLLFFLSRGKAPANNATLAAQLASQKIALDNAAAMEKVQVGGQVEQTKLAADSQNLQTRTAGHSQDLQTRTAGQVADYTTRFNDALAGLLGHLQLKGLINTNKTASDIAEINKNLQQDISANQTWASVAGSAFGAVGGLVGLL